MKYAIERAFTANLANGYVQTYFGDLVGAPDEPGAYREIRGIETPDDETIVFKLERGTGAALAGALAMPISVPVPKEFARRFDREQPSTYGEEHAVFTGPYKVEGDAQGNLTGFTPGRRLSLVRNPQYSDTGDYRPAFLDAIEFQSGNDDIATATRRILSGESMASGDLQPPASRLKSLLESDREQLSVVPGGGWRAISMDTSRPPFDDLDVRKAVIAGFNRTAARQQRGGEALGPIAQHYIPPGMAGFEESNGDEGWREFDWMGAPEGDRELSAKYFRAAGYASGKYEGGEPLLLVSDNAEPDKSIAQITEQQLNEMGFETKLRLVTRDTMLTKFCQVSGSEVNVCPSFGWAAGLLRPADRARPHVQRRADPRGEQRQLVRARRSGGERRARQGEGDDGAGRAGEGVRRGQQADRRAGAGDPVHVGLPVGRRVAERARRAERLLDDVGLELHVAAVIS